MARTSRMEGAADSRAAPQQVWNVLAAPERMGEWFSGAADVEALDGWPAPGARLKWRVGPSRFEARVVEADAPRVLRLAVETPAASSQVTVRIAPKPDGGARCERVVEATWKGVMGPLLGKLIVAPSVKREVQKLALAAEKP